MFNTFHFIIYLHGSGELWEETDEEGYGDNNMKKRTVSPFCQCLVFVSRQYYKNERIKFSTWKNVMNS